MVTRSSASYDMFLRHSSFRFHLEQKYWHRQVRTPRKILPLNLHQFNYLKMINQISLDYISRPMFVELGVVEQVLNWCLFIKQ